MSDLDAMQEWCANQMSADDHLHTTQRSTNFVEITRLPKKIDAVSIAPMRTLLDIYRKEVTILIDNSSY